MKTKRIIALLLCILMVVALAACGEKEKYEEAEEYIAKGDYAAALELFREIPDYEDTQDRIKECETEIANAENYEAAGKAFEEEDYKTAAETYEALGEYKDSADKYAESQYLYGVSLMEADEPDYAAAKEAFTKIPDYIAEDAEREAKLRSCNYNILSDYIKDNGVPYKKLDKKFTDHTTLLEEEYTYLTKDYKDESGNKYTLLASYDPSDGSLELHYFRRYTQETNTAQYGTVYWISGSYIPLKGSADGGGSAYSIAIGYIEKGGTEYYITALYGSFYNSKDEDDTSIIDLAKMNKDTKWKPSLIFDPVGELTIVENDSEDATSLTQSHAANVEEILENGDDLIKDSGITLKDLGFTSL